MIGLDSKAAKWESKKATKQRKDIIKESSKNSYLRARKLAVNVASMSGTIITLQTVKNILHDANIRGRLFIVEIFGGES